MINTGYCRKLMTSTGTNTGAHHNDDHLRKYVTWCREWLNQEPAANWVKEESKTLFEGEVDELNEELDRLLNEYIGSGNMPVEHEASMVFYALKDYADNNYEHEFMWGAWLDEDQNLTHPDGVTPLGHGGDALKSSTLLYMSSLIRHEYSRRPDPLTLQLTQVSQADKSVFIGSATAAELDSICSVPNLDPGLSSAEFGGKLLRGAMPEDQWQRVVNATRIRDIAKFIDKDDSYIFNPVVIYLDKESFSEFVHIPEPDPSTMRSEAVVNYEFLIQQKNHKITDYDTHTFTDYEPIPSQTDVRPFKIVDGQHRVRGLSMSVRGHNLSIPFVLIVGNQSKADRLMIAKVFTEINTNSVALDPLHQLYLRYKFSMSDQRQGKNGPVCGPNDFDTEIDGVTPTKCGRPNRRAYELAMMMASTSKSPLYDMVEFQRPAIKGRRRANKICISATNWVAYARKWFLPGGSIYAELETDDYNRDEVMNYFQAFEETCTKNWPNEPRWKPGWGRGKPLLQFEGPFLALLELFPKLVTHVRENEAVTGAIPRQTFVQYLAPLQNVDWNAPSLKKSNLSGRKNDNVRHLVVWMETAILMKTSGTVDEILDRSLESVAGKGLLANPAAASIRKVSGGDWPTTSSPLQFQVEYPLHTLGSNWTVKWLTAKNPVGWDPSDMQSLGAIAVKTSASGTKRTELTITSDNVPRHAIGIEVECSLKNGNGETSSTRESFHRA